MFKLELKKLLILLKSEPKSLMAGIIAQTIILLVKETGAENNKVKEPEGLAKQELDLLF